MQVGVMRKGLAFVVVAVLSVVVVTSSLIHRTEATSGQKWPFGLRVAHPQQMKAIPEELIPVP